MAVDPVDVSADNIHSFNRYAYANNNPYVYVDPDGRAAETALDIISLGLSIAEFNRDPGILTGLGVAYDGLATAVPFLPAGFGIIRGAGRVADAADVPKWGVPEGVTNKFPSGWGNKANKKGVGTRWQDPNNPGNGVRIDQGNPNHSLPSQQVDHVIVRRDGQVIGRDGNPIQGSIKENAEQAHIPLSEYQNWKSWDSPQ
jgi:hypothetical protein